jgi:uncharacterized protein YqhQ
MGLLARGKEEQSLAFGGQALIEGIMIRSRTHLVICIRQTEERILTHVEELKPATQRHWALRLPLIRGIVALFETMYLGVKGVYFSANAVLEEEQEELTWREWTIVAVLTIGLSSIFIVVPFLLTSLLHLTGVIFNLVEAVVRLALFLAYIALVSRWKEFRRVLQYHGAEHKAINAHEAGVALEVASVRRFSRLHRRCGTSFIFFVIIVSILLFSVVPRDGFLIRLSYRFLLIPVIGAVSYELLRYSGKHGDSTVVKILTMPGLAFQRLTTREPEDTMIEVAIRAVQEVIRLSDS